MLALWVYYLFTIIIVNAEKECIKGTYDCFCPMPYVLHCENITFFPDVVSSIRQRIVFVDIQETSLSKLPSFDNNRWPRLEFITLRSNPFLSCNEIKKIKDNKNIFFVDHDCDDLNNLMVNNSTSLLIQYHEMFEKIQESSNNLVTTIISTSESIFISVIIFLYIIIYIYKKNIIGNKSKKYSTNDIDNEIGHEDMTGSIYSLKSSDGRIQENDIV